jgi:hypothetical protein
MLNHRSGADGTEQALAIVTDNNDRYWERSGAELVDVYTRYDFAARNNKYSAFKWRWYHFDGVDYARNRFDDNAIYRFVGDDKYWDDVFSQEYGNYDYLLGADVDMDHPDVKAELKLWGEWYVTFADLDGFRLDAVKHIKTGFFNEWLTHLRQTTGRELFTVGEYWDYNVETLLAYLELHNDKRNQLALFDAPLHNNFHNASKSKGFYDMNAILNNTLMQRAPTLAVTLVDNHDTQPLQGLESPVADWFKPLAYAIILLREDGYPSVFYADYYGASYRDYGHDGNQYDIVMRSHKTVIDRLLDIRRRFAYGVQREYFDHRDIVGWTRSGDHQSPEGLAVIMSDGPGGHKWMEVGREHAGECFRAKLSNQQGCVMINNDGWGRFRTGGGSLAVWVGEH